jgi:hypothetical protein
VELALDAPSLLRGLLLEDAERSELALRVDDPFHRGGTERADQLVLQVGTAPGPDIDDDAAARAASLATSLGRCSGPG